MMLTQNFRRRNVAYARYQRALIALLLFPISAWQEIVAPSSTHALRMGAVTCMGLLAGWMYRESVRWWTDVPTSDD